MCMQCMAGASLAVGSATGIRAWLATQTWMTPRRMKRVTIALLAGALAASATIPGSAPTSISAADRAAPTANPQQP